MAKMRTIKEHVKTEEGQAALGRGQGYAPSWVSMAMELGVQESRWWHAIKNVRSLMLNT